MYCKGLAAERGIVSIRHRELAWAADITDSRKRTLLRILTGQIMNFKLISMCTAGRVSPLCPLCHAPDSTSHIVCGGCAHADMRSGVIKRHDNAVRIVLSALLKGSMGANAIMADVCTDANDDSETDGVVHGTTVIPRTLPAHLLASLRIRIARALTNVKDRDVPVRTTAGSPAPSSADLDICRLLQAKFGTEGESFTDLRDRLDVATINLRPDMAVFVGGAYQHKRKRAVRGNSWDDDRCDAYCGDRRMLIVEVGYVREGFATTKQLEKRAKHALLEYLLKDMGWRTECHTITLGVTGTIYNDALATMASIGISASAAASVIRAWVHMTLNHTHGLVTRRRELDNHYINKAFQRPP